MIKKPAAAGFLLAVILIPAVKNPRRGLSTYANALREP